MFVGLAYLSKHEIKVIYEEFPASDFTASGQAPAV